MQKITVRYQRKKRYRFSPLKVLGGILNALLWIWALRGAVIPTLLMYLLYQCST